MFILRWLHFQLDLISKRVHPLGNLAVDGQVIEPLVPSLEHFLLIRVIELLNRIFYSREVFVKLCSDDVPLLQLPSKQRAIPGQFFEHFSLLEIRLHDNRVSTHLFNTF